LSVCADCLCGDETVATVFAHLGTVDQWVAVATVASGFIIGLLNAGVAWQGNKLGATVVGGSTITSG
jgi:hypothetical protein